MENINEKYKKRIADNILKAKLKYFKAINLVGPKWCGKTWTGLKQSKSHIFLQNFLDKDELLLMLKNKRNYFLGGNKPRLIDEWQDLPQIWDLVRYECDQTTTYGNYILTGSSSKKIKTSHTGTGRIHTFKMYPLSLYESNESNGEVSLRDLFNNTVNKKGWDTNLKFDDLIFAICRGGWPETVFNLPKNESFDRAKDYFKQIYQNDIFNIDSKKRNSNKMLAVLKSYSRNIATEAKITTLVNDLEENFAINRLTLIDYLDVLTRLYVINEIPCWSQNIRSSDWIKTAYKHTFVDPSLAVAALNMNPKSLSEDMRTLGLIFENLCIRDLLVYSSPLNGQLSYYRDRLGTEIDCVITTDDGKIGLIEIKLGFVYYEQAAKNLNKVEELIKQYNQKNPKQKIPEPSFKMIITGDQIGYKREDGIYIVPIGCLKD